MKWRPILVVLYALLIFIGGMIGFAKAHSLPSLVMGITAALLLLGSAWGISRAHRYGEITSLIISWGLTVFFSYRFYLSLKMMPAGMMAIVSFIVGTVVLFSLRKTGTFSDKTRSKSDTY